MFDLEPTPANGGEQGDWKTVVSERLAHLAPEIAHLIEAGHDADSLRFGLEKYGHHAISLDLVLGDRHAHLKLYHGTPGARAAYDRNRRVHLALRDTGLTPRLIAFSDTQRFVMTEHVDTITWTEAMHGIGPARIASRMGDWLARYDYHAPSRPASGNWHDYLARFGDEVPQVALQQTAEMLSAIPVQGLVVSRGDPALHNYLITGDGDILGCDFDDARLHPRGWDFAMAHHALVSRMPDQANTLIQEMNAGFTHAYKGAMQVDELYDLASAFSLIMALRGRTTEDTPDGR